MFALERIRIIKHQLENAKQAQVHTLANMLGVSEVTIRRDLEKLEKEGFLIRTHGGAIIREKEEVLPDVDDDQIKKKHREIAELAAYMIHPMDIIMLTSGDINALIAEAIKSKQGITVLTNDMAVAGIIAGQKMNKVVLLGGDVDLNKRSLYGSLTLSNLKKYHVKKAFLEIDGVSSDLLLSTSSQEKADLIRGAMEVSGEKVFLCRADLFNSSAFFHLGPMSIADKIITNPSLPNELKQEIFFRNHKLYTSINAFEGSI